MFADVIAFQVKEKKSKYDTNPLDPDFVRESDEAFGVDHSTSAPTAEVRGATRDIGHTANEENRRRAESEAPTRRYDRPPQEAPYPSVFVPPTYAPPSVHHPPAEKPPLLKTRPSGRTVAGIGLPENLTLILPYIPFHIGAVLAAIELFLVPRKEGLARFHAAQGLAIQLAIILVTFFFNTLRAFTGSGFGATLFWFVSTIFLIVSIIRVWKGEDHRIAPVSEVTRWLNEKIEPRKSS